MPTVKDLAEAYAAATDGCRRSVLATRHNARTIHRVKPDLETNPLAEFDYEEGATWAEHMPQATPLRASTSAR